MKKILIIDDDAYICNLLEELLKEVGYATDKTFRGLKGLQKIKDNHFDLVLLDYRLPDTDGLTLLKGIKKISNSLPVIIITAYADVRSAVKLIKAGAFDYVTKPILPEEIIALIKEAMRGVRKSPDQASFEKEFLTGESIEMQEIMRLAKIVAPTDMTVLIEGETGTGKEYISRTIHYNSKRKQKPFVAVDCGAIPYELANSELFGHVKGAFTGAIRDKVGSFEIAHEGTLFLDEIGNLPYEVQVKLLRVLQERTINRTGENKDIHIDVRIIAASNEPLINLVDENKFRDDLYHRINEFKITVPPLRERQEDIMLFAEHFRKLSNYELSKSVNNFTSEVKKILKNYEWHGNLRELRNFVKHAVLLCNAEAIDISHLPEELQKDHVRSSDPEVVFPEPNLKKASQQAEREAIIEALHKTNYNKSKAAKILKIDRKTLYNKINKFNIDLYKN